MGACDGMNNVGFLPNALARLPAVPSPRTAKTVASIGLTSDQKGIDLLLDTWALVAPARPDWRLRVHGAGEDEAALKARCTGLGLDGSVEWMGRTDDVERALADASVFVQSSRGEGFPLALLEAMASGVPCAAFDCAPGVREIVRDGEDGLLAPKPGTSPPSPTGCCGSPATPGCATRSAPVPAPASSGSPNRRRCAAGRSCSRSWSAEHPCSARAFSPARPPRPRPGRAGPQASGGRRTAPAAAARRSP